MVGRVRSILDIQLLGEFHLLYDGRPVTAFFQGRLQGLLVYLLLHRHVPQSRQQIAFLFWPNTPEHQARNNLRQLLHYLRRALPSADQFLRADAKTIQWQTDALYRLDVADFEQALAKATVAAKEGRVHAQQKALELAMERYNGELLPGFYDDWILPERERLSRAYSMALQRLVQLGLEQQHYDRAVVYGEHLLNNDPLDEQTYVLLIHLHALRGDRTAAARIFYRCAQVLKRELGVAPGSPTLAAYRQALNLGEPSLTPAQEPLDVAASHALVNRREAWADLQAAWQRASSGQASLALISGEAGIGKTCLAEELLQTTRDAGATVARMKARVAERKLAYAPLIGLLRSEPCRSRLFTLDNVWRDELARLLPELSRPRPRGAGKPVADVDLRRRRLLEALTRATPAGSEPFLLFFDDVHWSDRDTIEWLHFLLQYHNDSMLLVLGAVRPEEVDEGHPLNTLLLDLRLRERVSEIRLGPLEPPDTGALAGQVARLGLDDRLVLALHRYTEGNPFFIVETIRAVLDNSPFSSAPPSPADLLPFRHRPPSKVHDLIESRLRRLSADAQELAGLAATLGRVFTTDVLVAASEQPEEVIVPLVEELCKRDILRDLDGTIYCFSHGCICQIAYTRQSTARRRLYHRRAARALETVYSAGAGDVRAQIMHHKRQAGQRTKPQNQTGDAS